MDLRALRRSDLDSLGELAALAQSEGFEFVGRLRNELARGEIQLDARCEFFIVRSEGKLLLAVGGVTPDPYVDDSRIGRLRHVYVRPEVRGSGIGRALVIHLESRAAECYASLRLRTDTDVARRFYERLGYEPVESASATHRRPLIGKLSAATT